MFLFEEVQYARGFIHPPGTLASKLWRVLDPGHYDVELTRDEMRAIKCWTDLNCPLWPDYQFRPDRRNHALTAKQ